MSAVTCLLRLMRVDRRICVCLHLGIKYQHGLDTSLKTHLSFDSAIVHRPLLLYSLAKHHVHARFCIVNSVPSESVHVYNDLMGQRTNTVKLNWLLYVGSYGIIQHTLSDRTYMCCVVRVPYRLLSNSRSGWVDVQSIDSICFTQKLINSN